MQLFVDILLWLADSGTGFESWPELCMSNFAFWARQFKLDEGRIHPSLIKLSSDSNEVNNVASSILSLAIVPERDSPIGHCSLCAVPEERTAHRKPSSKRPSHTKHRPALASSSLQPGGHGWLCLHVILFWQIFYMSTYSRLGWVKLPLTDRQRQPRLQNHATKPSLSMCLWDLYPIRISISGTFFDFRLLLREKIRITFASWTPNQQREESIKILCCPRYNSKPHVGEEWCTQLKHTK